jgi:hypothetical protein
MKLPAHQAGPFKNTLTGVGKSNNGITLFKEKGFNTTWVSSHF